MRLEWSARALTERRAIFRFVEAEKPRAAALIDKRIDDQIQLLVRFPQLGQIGRAAGTRELVIGETPFVVAYRVGGDALRVLRILHGAQRWPGPDGKH